MERVTRSIDACARGVRIAVDDAGPPDAPALVLLHPFPFSRRYWEPQLRTFRDVRRVLAPDARGVGGSDAGPAPVTLEALVDDLFAVLDRLLGGDPAVACGLSMGGYILLRAVEREPERFRGLVLCDTRSEPDGDGTRLDRASAIRRIQDRGLPSYVDELLPRLLAPGTEGRHPSLVERLRRDALSNAPAGIAALLGAMAGRTGTTDSLGRVSVPALVVAGEADALTPPELARGLASRIPGARFEEIPGAGHLSSAEHPESFDRTLLGFLDALDSAT